MPKVIHYVTNGNRLSAKYRVLARSIKADTVSQTRREMARVKDLAVLYSSGTAYKIGRDKGYPYSRSNPHPPAPPYIINVQSGKFRKSWFVRESLSATGAITWRLYNTRAYSGYMTGTSRMIERPILKKVFEDFDPQMFSRIMREFRTKAARIRVSDPIPNIGWGGVALAIGGAIASGIHEGVKEGSSGR